jgi:diguanylate cyclase
VIRAALCDEREGEWALVKGLLRDHVGSVDVRWERSFEGARRAIERGDHDVFLIDEGLGGGRGLELLRESLEGGSGAAMVLVTQQTDVQLELQAIRAGAAEVIAREGMSPRSLAGAITRARARATSFAPGGGSSQDDTLVSASALRTRLDVALSRARKTRDPVALLMVHVSDASGGDGSFDGAAGAVLVAATERIRSCLRDFDSVCRLGDAEFLVLLGELDQATQAAIFADRVVGALTTPLAVRGTAPQVRVSVGIAVAPNDGQTSPELLRAAEHAVKESEQAKSSRFRFRSAPMNEQAERRRVLLRALDGALDRGEFALAYQPQVSVKTNAVLGVEALLRWTSTKIGPVSPAEFVPVLESAGMIDRVGSWVLDRACEQSAEWQRRGLSTRVSVNVSARQFAAGGFGDLVSSALHRHDLPPSLLGIELTEGVLLEDAPAVRMLLHGIRKSGVSIAVDDFGTGYASLSYIKRFPMDVIKIDKEFVRGLPLDVENVAITNAIVALARSLGLKVVAEGVETVAELEFLRAVECDAIQGYYFAKPMFPPDYEAWRLRHEAQPR